MTKVEKHAEYVMDHTDMAVMAYLENRGGVLSYLERTYGKRGTTGENRRRPERGSKTFD